MKPRSLNEEAEDFANELQDLIRSVLVRNRRTRITSHTKGNLVVVRPGTSDVRPVKLYCGVQHVASLSIDYKMEWNTVRRFLRVRSSALKILSLSNRPVLRLDFNGEMNRVPVSHWNVHGESTELGRILPSKTGTRLSELHFSTGGVRFRPALEDLLEMAILDLGVEAVPGWQQVIEEHRQTWRLKQLAAAVHDSPETAAGVLTDLKYEVTPPKDGHPSDRSNHLRKS